MQYEQVKPSEELDESATSPEPIAEKTPEEFEKQDIFENEDKREILNEEESAEKMEEEKENLRISLRNIYDTAPKSREQSFPDSKLQEYIAHHIPNHLKREETSAIYKIVKYVSRFGLKDILGKENLPASPKLFISNHRGGETGRLIASLDDEVHIAASETINWSRKPLAWVMKKLGMVPIKESFANLNEEQKSEVIEKAPKSEKTLHEAATKSKGWGNTKNIRTMAALLARGDDVAIFAEGPFTRLDDDEHRAYAGYALVAREYKRITGKNLDIVPTGIRNNKVSFGDAFAIDRTKKMSTEELQDIATKKIHTLYDSLVNKYKEEEYEDGDIRKAA